MTKPTDTLHVQTPGVVSGTPTPTITGRWRRDELPISGATGIDYTLVDDDYNHVIDYAETATNSAGTATLDSNNFLVESARPIPATLPYIVASQNPPVAGTVWTATPGVYIGTQPITVARAWLADGVPIAGETGLTYTTLAGDVGKVITYQETATNSIGPRVTVIDAGLGPIQGPSGPVATTPPAISVNGGGPIKTNSALTATPGVWSGAPTVTGAWYRNGIAILGATALTYACTAADEGGTITYRERATNAAGVAWSPSNELGPVALVQTFLTKAATPNATYVVYSTSPGSPVVDTIEKTTASGSPNVTYGICLSEGFEVITAGGHYTSAVEILIEDLPIDQNEYQGAWVVQLYPGVNEGLPGTVVGPTSIYAFGWHAGGWRVCTQPNGGSLASGTTPFGIGDIVGFAFVRGPATNGNASNYDLSVRCYKNGVLLTTYPLYSNLGFSSFYLPNLYAPYTTRGGKVRAILDADEMAYFASYGADYGSPSRPPPRRRLPELMQEPVLTGTPVVGQTIARAVGQWQASTSDPGALTVSGNWYRDEALIVGSQNAATHDVIAADVGHLLTYRERATSATGRLSDLWSSDAVGPATAT
ncbi:MAG: hypothetical protein ACOYBR_09770 [Fluviibacter sp.]